MKGFVRRQGILSENPMGLPYPHELPGVWPLESTWEEGDFCFGGFAPPPLDINGSEFWPGFGMDALVEYLGLLSI
jgi:hypothetical protein